VSLLAIQSVIDTRNNPTDFGFAASAAGLLEQLQPFRAGNQTVAELDSDRYIDCMTLG
jgi:hypothetical protein